MKKELENQVYPSDFQWLTGYWFSAAVVAGFAQDRGQ
jgi:hypothetical protein